MAFVVGEVELSPSSLTKLAGQTKQLIPTSGTRYVLLDSSRDSNFLSSNTINNPDGTHDGGLGIVDNPLFFYTSALDPKSGRSREYPNKFLWIGTPIGTNDATDKFSIYLADVNKSAFYPGAPAATWLVNPRLILHVSQAKKDVTSWFDANYPGGAVGGKGINNSGSNKTYGKLLGSNPSYGGDSSDVGDISKMDSLDGQFWPVYDYVDNSVLLYFSIKTPNINTLSIYCYKIADTEFSSPSGSSEFLGGIYATVWRGDGIHTVTSSHRFSLISPDPLVAAGRVKGQQSAVGLYCYGPQDVKTPDHGKFVQGFILNDIHGSPTNWDTPFAISSTGGPDVFGMYNPDKLGSIQAISSGNNHVQGSYACIYNATSDRDIRASSNNVVISAMQIRVCYYQPASAAITFGSQPIITQGQVNAIGHCRPQFTFLPDGLPKVLTAAFTFDGYLDLGYQYFPPEALLPERQKVLGQTYDIFSNGFFIPTYGKKKARLIMNQGVLSGVNASADPQNIQTVAQVMEAYSLSSTLGQPYDTFNDLGTLIMNTQNSPFGFAGYSDFGKILDLWFEQIDAPFLLVKPLGAGKGTYVWGIVNLED